MENYILLCLFYNIDVDFGYPIMVMSTFEYSEAQGNMGESMFDLVLFLIFKKKCVS